MLSTRRALVAVLVLTVAWLSVPRLGAQTTTAPGATLTRWDADAVRAVAGEIQTSAELARQLVSQQFKTGAPEHSLAVTDLQALTSAAATLAQLVSKLPGESEPTRGEFLRLVDSYNKARQTILAGKFDPQIAVSMERIGVLLSQMEGVYTRSWRYQSVREAAGQAAQAAERLYELSRPQLREDRPADRHLLHHLQQLAGSAQYFARQLEATRDPAATDEDLRTLLADYGRTSLALYRSPAASLMRIEFDRVGLALLQISKAYRLPWSWQAARTLTEQIHTSTQQLIGLAADRSHYGDAAEAGTLPALTLVGRCAQDLLRGLAQPQASPVNTQPEFLALLEAYERAGFPVARASFSAQVMGEFDRVGGLLSQLNRMYSSSAEPGQQQLLIGAPVDRQRRPSAPSRP
jgi:hypothetical protein